MERKIIFFENPFIAFYQNLDIKVKGKIKYAFELIKQVDRVPEKFLKHITGTGGLYEIRIAYQQTFIGSSVALMMVALWFCLMAFKKKLKKHRKKKLIKPYTSCINILLIKTRHHEQV